MGSCRIVCAYKKDFLLFFGLSHFSPIHLSSEALPQTPESVEPISYGLKRTDTGYQIPDKLEEEFLFFWYLETGVLACQRLPIPWPVRTEKAKLRHEALEKPASERLMENGQMQGFRNPEE